MGMIRTAFSRFVQRFQAPSGCVVHQGFADAFNREFGDTLRVLGVSLIKPDLSYFRDNLEFHIVEAGNTRTILAPVIKGRMPFAKAIHSVTVLPDSVRIFLYKDALDMDPHALMQQFRDYFQQHARPQIEAHHKRVVQTQSLQHAAHAAWDGLDRSI